MHNIPDKMYKYALECKKKGIAWFIYNDSYRHWIANTDSVLKLKEVRPDAGHSN